MDGSGGWVRVSTVAGQTGLGKYIPVLPNDPQGSNAPGGSGYEFVSNGEYYELKATFEAKNIQQNKLLKMAETKLANTKLEQWLDLVFN